MEVKMTVENERRMRLNNGKIVSIKNVNPEAILTLGELARREVLVHPLIFEVRGDDNEFFNINILDIKEFIE